MSKHITQKNDISTYLEFSNLQIASEAFIGKSQLENPGTIISGNKFERNNLIKGNDHTSKFTETAADEFMQHLAGCRTYYQYQNGVFRHLV